MDTLCGGSPPPLPSAPLMHASSEAALLGLLNEHRSLGNAKARQLLGLDEAAYESLKAELLDKGMIAQGRGRGGSIRLAHTGLATLQRGPTGRAGHQPGPHNNSNNATPEPAEPKGERDGRATPGPGEPTGKRGRKARLVHGEPSKKNGSTGLATLQRGPTKNAGLEPGEPTSSKKQRATLERGAPSKQRATLE